MKLMPLQDRVVVKMVEAEETTASGIILTGSAKEKPQVAEVVAVGPGIKDGEHPDREAMESFRNKQNEAVKKILTEEQYKTYSEQMQHRGRHGHGSGGHGPRGNN